MTTAAGEGMSAWYYSTDRQQPNGPVDIDTLQQLLGSGQLADDTLFWREGLSRWHRREELADELPLAPDRPGVPPPAAPLPPALPATRPLPGPLPANLPAPPKPRRTGLILALIAGGMLLVSLPVIGILAAIAIPAYQSYTERAQIAATLAALAPLQAQVAAHKQANGQCPAQDSPGFKPAAAYAAPQAHLAEVEVVTAANGHCGLAARLAGLYRDAEKRQAWLWLEHDPAQAEWICRSTLRDTQLPARCQR